MRSRRHRLRVSAFAARIAIASLAVTIVRHAAADAPPAYDVRRAVLPIRIDGVAAEPAWESSPWISSFMAAGAAAVPATNATRARMLWDEDYLYFLAELSDDDIVVASRVDDDRLWLGDVFELFFKPDAGPAYYELQVNPANARLDMYLPQRAADAYQRWRSARPFAWETAVQRSAPGWVVEGRIPWRDFTPTGGRPDAGDTWRFALCRYDYGAHGAPSITSNAPFSRLDFHRWEEWPQLRFSPP